MAAVALAASLLLVRAGIFPGWWLLIQAAVLGAALLFERSGYHPKVPDPSALRQTGERFRDPATGQLVEVWEDPRTGAREYRPGARE